jgi:uncharacterized delta-60 repeat protein
MKRLPILIGLALLTLGPLGVGSAATAPLAGDLDSSFGTGGVVTQGPGEAIAIEPDGKIVVVGGDTLTRYLPDGSLDPTFGNHGNVALSLDPAASYAGVHAVALQPDGKIVVAGTGDGLENENVLNQFMLARYNANGSLDTSFGTNGIVNTAIPEPGAQYRSAIADAVSVLSDGDIVAGGTASVSGFPDQTFFALVRYAPAGSLDPTFGDEGIAQAAFSGYDTLAGIAIQADGKIVASGDSWGGDHGDDSEQVALARFESDGSLDSTFGTTGKVTTAKKLWYEGGPSALQGGKILVAGARVNDNGYGLFGVVARYWTDGRLDTSFGSHGYADVPQIKSAAAVLTQSDGNILVLGQKTLVRLTPNGRVDPSFGTRGVASLGGGGQALALALQENGKILVGGGASGSGGSLMRLIGGNNCVVPRLRGTTLAKASTTLKKSYCNRGRISRRFSSKVKRGRVLSTSPVHGARLSDGTRVALVVSRGRPARR